MSADGGIAGRVAFVTGAGRNLGRSIAAALAGAGATVACGWRSDAEAARATCAEIAERGGAAYPVRIDLERVDSIQAAVTEVGARGAGLDILVHNSAIRPHTALAAVTPDEWDRVQRVNVRGPFFLTQAAVPLMGAQGRIVFVGGLDAYWAGRELTQVATSKLAAVGMARALASELGPAGITVNTIVSGPIEPAPGRLGEAATAGWLERIPMGRFGTRDEIADACLFLASDAARFITGQELFVTGGASPLVGHPEH